jgi:effector-binding domain-containing protein
MRFFKISFYTALFLFVAYAVGMMFVEENKSVVLKNEIKHPISKVFPQFEALQNLSQWHQFLFDEQSSYTYFQPYQGPNSSMSFRLKTDSSQVGECYVRAVKPLKKMVYEVYINKNHQPYHIEVDFKALPNQHTQLTWRVANPKLGYFMRVKNLWSEFSIEEDLNKGLANLNKILGGKMDKEAMLSAIKYDTLMVEQQPAQILIGLSASVQHKKDELQKSIQMNEAKLKTFLTKDLSKKEDEFGQTMVIYEATDDVVTQVKRKRVTSKNYSYFMGAAVKQKFGISDNNFTYRESPVGKNLVIYFQGDYSNKAAYASKLYQKAKKDTLKVGPMKELFIKSPSGQNEAIVKLMLPIHP